MAIGVVMGILPTFGLGIPLAILFSIILKANRVSAVVGSMIMNPWTTPVFWGASYFIGSLILGKKAADTLRDISNLRSSGNWSAVLGKEILVPYIFGNIAVSALFGITFYFISYELVKAYRIVKMKRRMKRVNPFDPS